MMLSFLIRSLAFLFLATSFLFSAPVEKAVRYHELLVKNADNETLMKRFLDAWLDESDRESLEKWLTAEVEAGGVAERRVLARYLDHIGAHEKALAQYEEVLKGEPGDAATQLAVAKLRAAGLDFEGALKILGEREDVEAVSLRGAYEHRVGNTKVALELWGGLLEKKPKDRALREDLVSLFRGEGLGKEARELQQDLIAMGKDPFQRALDQLDLGDLQLEGGLKEEVLASYEKVLVASGSGSWMEREALHKLEEIFRRERDADGLRVFLAKLREEMPHRLALQKSFARQQVVTGEVDEGVAAFREILRRTPGEGALRLEFVELLAFAERYEEAAEEMEALMAQGATVEQWLRLAELRGNFDKEAVLGTLGEVEKLKVGDAVGVLEVARIYARFDLDDEALRVLEAGRGEHAESREIAEALAVLLVELERDDEALGVWRAMAEKGGIEEVLRVAQSQRRLGLGKEAFALLAEHREEVAGAFGGLRLYCDLALAAGEAEAAWVGVRKLMTLAEGFSDLQVAVNLGSAIGRKYGLEKAIPELEGAEEENMLCLLATLQQVAGRLPEADAALARAEGKLARRHRVVLLTQRGDLVGAIAQLRGMMGKRVSLAQRRQLLDLLERQRDYVGALAEAEQWKISSPGEVQAWRKRAALFGQLGRHREAADELRRARNIFGRDDVDLTRELAKMQLPLGKHREALRLYEHLFRTAQTDQDRLGFIGEMYGAAEQAGLRSQLIMRFEREHEEAKRELLPLRLLAQIHKLSRDSGARQEVLLKLYRLLPDDDKVLFELAELAEENGDPAGARQLLLDHAARTSLLQRLAALQFKAGEIEAGLQILGKIAPGELTAGAVEATALQLWQLGEHQLVLEFFEENEAVVSADWRLRFLQSDFLETVGRSDEAREIWVELLGAEGALGRSVIRSHHSILMSQWGVGKMNQRYWLSLLGNHRLSDPFQQNQPMTLGHLPSDVEEVRWLSLVRLAKASLEADPSGEAWLPFLETLNHPWLVEVRGWGLFPKEKVGLLAEQKVAEMKPEMRAWKMVREPESSREDLLKLVTEFEDENPILANTCRIHAAFKLPEGVERMEALREVGILIASEDGGGIRNAQAFLQLLGFDLNFDVLPSLEGVQPSPSQYEELRVLEPWWNIWMERALAGDPAAIKGRDVRFALAVQNLSGDVEGFFKNLDRLAGIKAAPSTRSNPQLRYPQPLQGIPDRNSLLSQIAAQHLIHGLIYQAKAARLIPPDLLQKSREQGWEPEGQKRLVDFAKRIPEVKDGLLRALLYHKVGLEEKFVEEMEGRGERGRLEEKLDALALSQAPVQRGENKDILLSLLEMDRTGLSPTELTLLDAVTLGEARKNRRLREMDDEIKADLGEVLGRFAKGASGQSSARTLSLLYKPLGLKSPSKRKRYVSKPTHQRKSYRQLLGAKNGASQQGRGSEEDQRIRRLQSQVKGHFVSNKAAAVGRLRQLVSRDDFRGLKTKVLTLSQPGESRSYQKRFRYAQLCLAYDERQKAKEMLASLKAGRPYDSELDFLLLIAQEPDERARQLAELVGSGEIGKVISTLMSLANVAQGEEAFFEPYERLIVLMKERGNEFKLQDAGLILQTFQNFQNVSKKFEKRSLHRMASRLPKVKKDEDSKEGDWVLRVRQRKIILEAYGEMIRLRSIRGQVLNSLDQQKDVLQLTGSNVEWIVFEALKKEPVMEVDAKPKASPQNVSRHSYGFGSSAQNLTENLALKAVLDSEVFTEELVSELVRHAFLNEKQGGLVKAALEGDVVKMTSLLREYVEERKEESTHSLIVTQNNGGVDSPSEWAALLKTLLRSKRWEDPVRESLSQAMSGLLDEEAIVQSELLRVCELGGLEESLAALEEVAEAHFPAAAMYESYHDLQLAGAVPPEIEFKIKAGRSLMMALQNIPRAWIPLLTFLERSDRAVWVKVDKKRIRAEVQKRLNVMYKEVFYDRLRAEGFGSYDGLALLGAEEWTEAGEVSSWLERLMIPLKLAATEGRTYWMDVSKDCCEQVENITYLEAFIAMRKDFKIDDAERQKVLRSVLESELGELSGLNEGQLRGLANLVKRDFSELKVPEASEGLEGLLERLRSLPAEGVVERIQKLMANEKGLKALSDNEVQGLCARLATEGEVELVAGFWVAYLHTKERSWNYAASNENLLKRSPFRGKLDLADWVRFVGLVREALSEEPEMAKSMTYADEILYYQTTFYNYRNGRRSPAETVSFFDEMLKRDGLTEVDKRVLGGFILLANMSNQFEGNMIESFFLRLKKSALADHSPEIVETMLAASQLSGAREKDEDEDIDALEVIYSYLEDQELLPEFRVDLTWWMISKLGSNRLFRELANPESAAVALRDLLVQQSHGVTEGLAKANGIMAFVNEKIASVPEQLQKEIYEAWVDVLKVDIGRVMSSTTRGGNKKVRMSDRIFDFTDWGRRFPIPPQMINAGAQHLIGDLDVMRKLIRSGNVKLLANLLPDYEQKHFRTRQSDYSSVTKALEDEVLPALPPQDQMMLRCYLASLGDTNNWKTQVESVGHLQADRAVTAARLFVVNPPEEQVVRMRAIRYLKNSVEALKVMIPHFSDKLQDDLPALVKNHRGDFRYMLRWMEAGGAKTVHLFVLNLDRSLRMSGISEYGKELAELESLLAPSLTAVERMKLTCDIALLRDPREKEDDFATREMRMAKAARYILENPLPEVEWETEKKCIAQLVRSGLAEAERQALIRRNAKNLEEVDAAMLAALDPADVEMLGYQLRDAIAKGKSEAAMTCLQILVDDKVEMSERLRAQLVSAILPKVTLPLMAHVTLKEEDEAGEKGLGELKELSTKLFTLTFSGERSVGENAQRAVLFLAFATHCFTDDKNGFEALEKGLSDQGLSRLKEIGAKYKYHHSYGGGRSSQGEHRAISPATQPLYFDGEDYRSDGLKPLRERLFEVTLKHSFIGLPASAGEASIAELMTSLGLSITDLDLEEDVFASERGNFNLIASALLAGDEALFFALLPMEGEIFFESGLSSQRKILGNFSRSGNSEPRELGQDWWRKGASEKLDLIEDNFQRMHFEIFAQSLGVFSGVKDWAYDLKNLDHEMEEKIMALLPESGPVRTQVLVGLARRIQPESKLAKVLVAEASREGFSLNMSKDGPREISETERLGLFLAGWNCAIYSGDWSVLDRQLQSKLDEYLTGFVAQCAQVHALYQEAGEGGPTDGAFEKLAHFGVKKTEPSYEAWFEVLGLVAGAKTSSWKDKWQTLDAPQRPAAQAEMAAGLTAVLQELAWVKLSHAYGSMYHGNSIWKNSLTHEKSARVLAAIMDDDLGVFEVAQISPGKRVQLMLNTIDWQQMKACIETRFEGEEEIGLLTELGLSGRWSAVSREAFQAFVKSQASRVRAGSEGASKLWLKVVRDRISADDLEGAKAAREKIDFAHLKDHEIENLARRFEALEAKPK